MAEHRPGGRSRAARPVLRRKSSTYFFLPFFFFLSFFLSFFLLIARSLVVARNAIVGPSYPLAGSSCPAGSGGGHTPPRRTAQRMPLS